MSNSENSSNRAIAAISRTIENAVQAIRSGTCPGTEDASPEALADKLARARALSEGGDDLAALPLALELLPAAPGDWRHSSLAGRCAHRLGLYQEAASLFCMSLAMRRTPAVAYALAESLRACGLVAEALRTYDIAAHWARGQEGGDELRERARRAAHDLHLEMAP